MTVAGTRAEDEEMESSRYSAGEIGRICCRLDQDRHPQHSSIIVEILIGTFSHSGLPHGSWPFCASLTWGFRLK